MSKKNGGLLTLVAGFAAGAAAVFLSKKANRIKTERELKVAARVATKLKSDFEKSPKKTVAKLEKKGERLVKKALVGKPARTATKAKKTARKSKRSK